MAKLLSQNFSVFSANAFSKSFETDSIYAFIGNPTSWAVPATPDTHIDSINDKKDMWNNIAGAFRVTSDKVAQGIERKNWTTGTVYSEYDSTITEVPSTFYALAGLTNRDVYKCLDNNDDSKSMSKPTQKDLAPYREYDGYVWKYMYTISEDDWINFATESVIPIKNDSKVSAAAVGGSIVNIPIYGANSFIGIGSDYHGTNYPNTTPGNTLRGANVISVSHSSTDLGAINIGFDGFISDDATSFADLYITGEFFNNCAVMFTSGRSKGEIRRIVDASGPVVTTGITLYTARTGEGFEAKNLPANTAGGGPGYDLVGSIDAGDNVFIGPHVTLKNDAGGVGFQGIGVVNATGNLISITVGDPGRGYSNTQLDLDISNEWKDSLIVTDGSGALANVYLSPSGGHGFNAMEELGAKYVIINAETPTGGTINDLVSPDYGMDFHQIGLLRNPIDPLTQKIAVGSIYDLRTHLLFDSSRVAYTELTTNYPLDSVITNANNSSRGTVWKVGQQDLQNETLSLVGTEGSFANGQYIQNQAGAATQILTANTTDINIRGKVSQNTIGVYAEQLTKYSGDIVYSENITSVNRYKDQKDAFKFIFEF